MNYSIGAKQLTTEEKEEMLQKDMIRGTRAPYNQLAGLGLNIFTDDELPDAQAAHEKIITNLMPAIAGANLIYGMGMLESGQTWSHEQLMIDNDIVTMVKRAIPGIDVTDGTMALNS